MSFNILTTGFFVKELKNLAKKYPSIKKDVASLCKQLEAENISDKIIEYRLKNLQ